MLGALIKLADELDSIGLHKYADHIDMLIKSAEGLSESERRLFDSVKPKKPSRPKLYGKFGSNRRYRQPTLGELKYIIEHDGVTKVIRLNGSEGMIVDPQTKLPMTESNEEKFVRYLGAEYKRMSAHDGGPTPIGDGVSGYSTSVKKVGQELSAGNTLIHCRHGTHRAGYLVASFLYNQGYTDKEALWQYMKKFEGDWDNIVCNARDGVGFATYLQGFYPIEEWCEVGDRQKKCRICEIWRSKYKVPETEEPSDSTKADVKN